MKNKLLLSLISLEHLFVDLICILTLTTASKASGISTDTVFIIYLVYNLIAFGTQFIWGSLLDRFQKNIFVLALSVILVICGIIFLNVDYLLSAVLAGIGNALFHVSGGSIVLENSNSRFADIGIFIAPGAIGVLLGTSLVANTGQLIFLCLISALIIIVIIYLFKKIPLPKALEKQQKIRILPILLLLTIIATRAFIGSIVLFPWKKDINLLYLLTAGVFFGKVFGGILADRFGWKKIIVASALMSIPAMMLNTLPIVGTLGSLLLNISTAITAVLVYREIPKYPATAFGLTCLALIIGGVPAYVPLLKNGLNGSILVPITLISSVIILILFIKYYKHE